MAVMSGPALAVIRSDALSLPLADCTVDLIVTSPPYFGLRSYQDGGEHYAGQIGAEPTPVEFVDALIAATREMVRVLKPSGSIWVNLGDKYSQRTAMRRSSHQDGLQPNRADLAKDWKASRERGEARMPRENVTDLSTGAFAPEKSLIGIPWRYAIRCIDELGLILRAEVIWSKPNGLPESVTDRVRRSHETWFHFTKSQRYFAAVDEVREPVAANYHDRPQFKRAMQLFNAANLTDEHMAAVRAVGVIDSKAGQVRSGGSWTSESGRLAAEVQTALGSYYRELCGNNVEGNPLGKLPGSVWTIPTQPLRVPPELGIDHFAAFPMEWPRRIIAGWSPVNGVVLDPFGGTGTTAMVARGLGRRGVSVDMSADYCRLARWRTNDPKQQAKASQDAKIKKVEQQSEVFAEVIEAPFIHPDQLDLFSESA